MAYRGFMVNSQNRFTKMGSSTPQQRLLESSEIKYSTIIYIILHFTYVIAESQVFLINLFSEHLTIIQHMKVIVFLTKKNTVVSI